MSLEKDLCEAVTDLLFEDPEAAEVVLNFVNRLNEDVRSQSAASMTKHLGAALVECEEAEGPLSAQDQLNEGN